MHRTFIALVFSAVAIAGCAVPHPFVGSNWQEEVVLSSGKAIVVERATVPGAVWYSTTGGAFYRVEQTLRLPDGTIWRSASLNPLVNSTEAVLLDHDARSWILVATSVFYGDHLRLGCPVPNFIYLRSSATGWSRVHPTDIPDGLQFNLLMLARWKTGVIDSMVSTSTKERVNAEWLAAEREKESRTYRAGTDNRYSWMNHLSYLVHFSKYCDPHTSQCTQVRHPTARQYLHPDCSPSNLLVAPK
jgi:hypothetical protein